MLSPDGTIAFICVSFSDLTIALATKEASASGSATPVPDECNRPDASVMHASNGVRAGSALSPRQPPGRRCRFDWSPARSRS